MSWHPGYGSHTDPTFHSRPRRTGEVVRRVAVYLRPYPFMVAGTIACAVLSLAFGFVYPKLTRIIFDEVIRARRLQWLAPAAGGLIAAFFLRELFNSLRIRINNHLEQNVIFDMRRAVYARLQRLPLAWFDPRASGDLMTRIIEDVNNVERLLIDGVEQGTVALLSIIGALVFMTLSNGTLTLVALIPAPLLLAGALWYTLTAHKRYRLQREASSAMNALLMDNLQGIRQIKAYARHDYEDRRFAERADDLRQGTLVVMRAWASYGPAMQFVGAAGIGLVLWVGSMDLTKCSSPRAPLPPASLTSSTAQKNPPIAGPFFASPSAETSSMKTSGLAILTTSMVKRSRDSIRARTRRPRGDPSSMPFPSTRARAK